MELNHAQKTAIYDDGFVVLPGVVPKVRINAALKAINHSVGEGMDRDEMVTMRSRSYCTELTSEPVMTNLVLGTPVWELAQSAIGHDRINKPTGSQIALRFPGLQDPPGAVGAHLDGMHSPHNGVPEGKILNFTMLVVVLLADVPEPYSGNFSAYPGTHHQYENYFRENGPEALLEGMPPIDMPEPTQICGKAGDVVLCHYQIAHTAAPNVSPNVRYAVIFRLSHVDHENQMHDVMTDIWREWEGMAEVVNERKAG